MVAKSKVHLVGIPFDDKSSFMKGAAEGPAQIRKVLHDGSSNYLSEKGLDIVNDIDLIDLGDLSGRDYNHLTKSIDQVVTADLFLFLGGDHSITFPLVNAVARYHTKFDILHFDAHTDLYHEFEEDAYSHACPFARIMEKNLCQRLVQIGIRSVSPHQQEQIDRFGVEVINIMQTERIDQLAFVNPLYISIDLDVFDPAFAPGVSHYEPGGLFPRDVIRCLQNIQVPILAADIVELNPRRDHHNMTAHLAAKLLKELCSAMIGWNANII